MAKQTTGHEDFEKVLMAYLTEMAKTDKSIAKNLKKPTKDISRCAAYIINEVKEHHKQGNVGILSDDECFGLAIHYYDEDNLEIDKVGEKEVADTKTSVQVSTGRASVSDTLSGEMSLF